MGQKTHPLGFRLGITQEHKSIWYANFNQYSNVLEEDDKIRTYIDTIAKVNNISNVKICRNGLTDQIQLNIETGKPGILVGDMGSGLETLLKNIKKILPPSRQLTINVFEVEKVDLQAISSSQSHDQNAAIAGDSSSHIPAPRVQRLSRPKSGRLETVRGYLQPNWSDRGRKRGYLKLQTATAVNAATAEAYPMTAVGPEHAKASRANTDHLSKAIHTLGQAKPKSASRVDIPGSAPSTP